jgi:signal transduction histidine kinase
LAQDLWLAKLTASKLARHPTLDTDAQKLCVELLRSIDSGLAEARTAVMAMRPVDGPTVTLAELIERQVNEFSDRFGIPAECRVQDGPPVPSRVAVELLRVMQEALNNVRKHASARRVWIKARQQRSSVTLSIRDDGVGFDPGVSGTGYGSQSMQERAQSLGGRLEIVSTPGRGTTVTVRVPVAQPSSLS